MNDQLNDNDVYRPAPGFAYCLLKHVSSRCHSVNIKLVFGLKMKWIVGCPIFTNHPNLLSDFINKPAAQAADADPSPLKIHQ